MYISITETPSEDMETDLERFQSTHLEALSKFPGVIAIYRYSRPDHRDEKTIIIWKDKESWTIYKKGELYKEVIKFESNIGIRSKTESYPLINSIKSGVRSIKGINL